jgi:predicted amidophosphoribosyltransferase
VLQVPDGIDVVFDRKAQQTVARPGKCPNCRKWLRLNLELCFCRSCLRQADGSRETGRSIQVADKGGTLFILWHLLSPMPC